jgi:hypothetical protein
VGDDDMASDMRDLTNSLLGAHERKLERERQERLDALDAEERQRSMAREAEEHELRMAALRANESKRGEQPAALSPDAMADIAQRIGTSASKWALSTVGASPEQLKRMNDSAQPLVPTLCHDLAKLDSTHAVKMDLWVDVLAYLVVLRTATEGIEFGDAIVKVLDGCKLPN